jgi:hypothetical protein
MTELVEKDPIHIVDTIRPPPHYQRRGAASGRDVGHGASRTARDASPSCPIGGTDPTRGSLVVHRKIRLGLTAKNTAIEGGLIAVRQPPRLNSHRRRVMTPFASPSAHPGSARAIAVARLEVRGSGQWPQWKQEMCVSCETDSAQISF